MSTQAAAATSLPTDLLNWDAKLKLFTGFASDIPGGVVRDFDIGYGKRRGFRFRSDRTQRELLMVEYRREIQQGDLVWIDYVPFHLAERIFLGITVRLYQ